MDPSPLESRYAQSSPQNRRDPRYVGFRAHVADGGDPDPLLHGHTGLPDAHGGALHAHGGIHGLYAVRPHPGTGRHPRPLGKARPPFRRRILRLHGLPGTDGFGGPVHPQLPRPRRAGGRGPGAWGQRHP